jgi:hypothetical protein
MNKSMLRWYHKESKSGTMRRFFLFRTEQRDRGTKRKDGETKEERRERKCKTATKTTIFRGGIKTQAFFREHEKPQHNIWIMDIQ